MQGLEVPPPGSAQQLDGHLSDTTASAPGSDDEVGSIAATDGSNLRTSPAEQAGSGGSESGGSTSAIDEHNGNSFNMFHYCYL